MRSITLPAKVILFVITMTFCAGLGSSEAITEYSNTEVLVRTVQ